MSETGTTTNGDVTLNYVLDAAPAADAPQLLLISGLGSPLTTYSDALVQTLVDRGFSVLRHDNRDTGKSSRMPAGGPTYYMSDMANDTLAVLDAVGWQQPIVLGVSMGGMIAQQFAIDHPDRLSALISVMSMSGKRGSGTATEEVRAALMAPAPTDREGWVEHSVKLSKIWCSPEFYDEDYNRERAYTNYDHGIDVAGTVRQYTAIMSSGERDEGLAKLDLPTLVIHGDADTLVLPDGGRHVADLIPGARYLEIQGMGHDLPRELWDRLADEITAFSQGIPEKGR